MKTQIRNLGIFLTVCYVILFAQLQRYTVFDAEELQEKPGNNRQEIRDFSAPRGTIATSDGVLLAESKKSDDKYKLQRTYPQGDLYAHIVGSFNPLSTGTSGVEKTYNKQLAGDLGFGLEQLNNLFSDENQVGNVTLTIRSDVQHLKNRGEAASHIVGNLMAALPGGNPEAPPAQVLRQLPSLENGSLAPALSEQRIKELPKSFTDKNADLLKTEL